MQYSLEDLMQAAKRTGVAVDGGMACLFYDFGKTPTSGTVGAKKTGLIIPANTIVESGLLKADTAVAGGFNFQLLTATDVLDNQSSLTVGSILNLNRQASDALNRELLINVTAITTGKILAWLRLYPS